MDGPIRLDKTGYYYFQPDTMPLAGSKITVVKFYESEDVHTFDEYTGTLHEVTRDAGNLTGVIFDRIPNHKQVNMGSPNFERDAVTTIIVFDNHVFMWKNLNANAETPLSLVTPPKAPRTGMGGKLRRRKRTTKKRKGRSRRVVR